MHMHKACMWSLQAMSCSCTHTKHNVHHCTHLIATDKVHQSATEHHHCTVCVACTLPASQSLCSDRASGPCARPVSRLAQRRLHPAPAPVCHLHATWHHHPLHHLLGHIRCSPQALWKGEVGRGGRAAATCPAAHWLACLLLRVPGAMNLTAAPLSCCQSALPCTHPPPRPDHPPLCPSLLSTHTGA
jgi:hypothetical protein